MKYNLDRARVTQTMCVVALYMAQTAVQLSQYALGLEAGTWDLKGSWERTAVDYVEMA